MFACSTGFLEKCISQSFVDVFMEYGQESKVQMSTILYHLLTKSMHTNITYVFMVVIIFYCNYFIHIQLLIFKIKLAVVPLKIMLYE